jgi:uncharacterized membrane protein
MTTSSATRRPALAEALLIVLAYLGPLCIVPLLRARQDPVIRWHGRHGLVLFLADIAIVAITLAIGGLLAFVAGGATLALFVLLEAMLLTALLVLHGIVIAAALEGERILIPGVSHHADRF